MGCFSLALLDESNTWHTLHFLFFELLSELADGQIQGVNILTDVFREVVYTNARMMAMFAAMAISLFKTPESILLHTNCQVSGVLRIYIKEIIRHRRLATTELGGYGACTAPGAMGRPAPCLTVARNYNLGFWLVSWGSACHHCDQVRQPSQDGAISSGLRYLWCDNPVKIGLKFRGCRTCLNGNRREGSEKRERPTAQDRSRCRPRGGSGGCGAGPANLP